MVIVSGMVLFFASDFVKVNGGDIWCQGGVHEAPQVDERVTLPVVKSQPHLGAAWRVLSREWVFGTDAFGIAAADPRCIVKVEPWDFKEVFSEYEWLRDMAAETDFVEMHGERFRALHRRAVELGIAVVYGDGAAERPMEKRIREAMTAMGLDPDETRSPHDPTGGSSGS